jgi:hypothetical protein
MTDERKIQLTIDVEAASTTVRGQIAVDGGPQTQFFGWLELIDHIVRAAGEQPCLGR